MPHQIAILGASGYTGAELVRLIATHPTMKIAALSADRKAGQEMADVFPHLRHLTLPKLTTIEEIDFSGIDLAFCALPHGLTHSFAQGLDKRVKIVDLSADFRLRDAAAYKKWYGLDHTAMDIQPEVAFGLPEVYREQIKKARITANTGCYVATSLLPLIPLLRAGAIAADGIVIDAKSGTSGAGRALREGNLFCEVNDGFSAYGVAHHRHMGELDQELSLAAGKPVAPTFTPHLLPMSRGMMATIYAAGDAARAQEALAAYYANEPFVQVLPLGKHPSTLHVRGSNLCHIGVVADRVDGRLIIVSVLDNLMKGASGQAMQNANIMLGIDETAGLTLSPVFP
ncbi:MAG: N-acetyl-gamma-glutamyl-phosphate reductase [Paracoccaceae bacterium]|nr:N-acetyl-gamma-glutamyl-phosphate reductase [Paracoccaceae bacterium]